MISYITIDYDTVSAIISTAIVLLLFILYRYLKHVPEIISTVRIYLIRILDELSNGNIDLTDAETANELLQTLPQYKRATVLSIIAASILLLVQIINVSVAVLLFSYGNPLYGCIYLVLAVIGISIAYAVLKSSAEIFNGILKTAGAGEEILSYIASRIYTPIPEATDE